MPKVVLLGTGAAVTESFRATTKIALENDVGIVAVDCGGDLVHRLLFAGLDPARLKALVLTHEHADHTSGFPLFMEKIWLLGRRKPIPVFGPEAALSQAERIFSAYDTSRWDGLPDIHWNVVGETLNATVFENWGWEVRSAPGEHGVPVLGFRFRSIETETVATYSSDTAPCEAIQQLATGSNLLIHEATGELKGHTSASQAARIAKEAGIGRLILVHLSPGAETALSAAQEIFPNTELGEELGAYRF